MEEVSIRELAEFICGIVGYDGASRSTRPSPMARPKTSQCNPADKSWLDATMPLRQGVAQTYAWFLKQYSSRNRV
jgi:nucleoside-diphosphate-sugar epimerase